MSSREKCLKIIDTYSDGQLADLALLLETNTIKDLQDAVADDAYCQGLLEKYMADPDKGEPMLLDDFVQTLGISL